jgi:RNA polymerase sigma-70 factor (ECF subfamily)
METMSTSAGGALPHDLMLSHAGSIRALALSILGDEHAAEDVLQETWLRALNKPPPRHDSIGGWLRRVAEGIAISRLRSEGRRRNRETQWVEDRDCSHTSYDATERAEVLRAVVDEVLALDEPYREAVMRRYFEGLPPREIATATESTVATVNSRLQRAQSKLRERLDRRLSDRCGGMNGALLALVGWPTEATAAATAGWMTKAGLAKITVGAVGTVAAVAALVWMSRDVERSAPTAPAVVVDSAPEARAAVELADIDRAAAERTSATTVVPSASGAAGEVFVAPRPGAFAFDLSIEPIDARGIAVANCRVWLGPEPGPLALVGATSWDGALRLAWRGDEPAVVLIVRAALAGSGSTPLRRVRVHAGGERVVRIALDGMRASELDVPVIGELPLVGSMFSPRPRRDEGQFLLDSAGNGLFRDPWLASGLGAPDLESGPAALAVIEPSKPSGSSEGVPSSAGHSTLTVRVVDGAGRPVEFATVTLSTARDAYRSELISDADGISVHRGAPSGAARVTVGRPRTRFPAATQRVDLSDSAARAIEIVLPDDPLARIRLLDTRGGARAGWLFELRDESGSTRARGEFDVDGRATVPIPDGIPARLLARADATGPGVVVESALIARDAEQVFKPSFEPHMKSLRVVVRGADSANVVVRVTRVDSGDALDAAPVDDLEPGEEGGRAFRVRGLSNGSYHVAAGSPQRGWLDGGEHEITGGRGALVVFVALDAAASLEIAHGEADRVRLLGHRAGMRIVSPDVRGAEGTRIAVAPGSFELFVERAVTPPTLRPIQLAPGTNVRVE